MLQRRFAGMLAIVALFSGCECACRGTDTDLAAHRERLLLAEEPDGALSILDLRESLATGEQSVVLVGRVGGMPQVFSREHASFAMIDPVAAMEQDAHEGCQDENCPFCSKKETDESGLALVHCVDHAGQMLAVDAPRLLGLTEDQTVVVRGRARIDELGNLIVLADGVYVRR